MDSHTAVLRITIVIINNSNNNNMYDTHYRHDDRDKILEDLLALLSRL